MKKENYIPKNEKETLEYADDTVSILDTQRLLGLKEFQNIQLLREEILKREKKRLEAKHGTNHPIVMEIETRLEYNKEMHVGLNTEIEKASIKQEPFDSSTWRVHGKVFDRESNPIKGLTVYLADQNKKWVEPVGNSCTNEKGYYSLTVDERVMASFEKDKPLYLSVSDKNKKVIYMSSEPLFATKGLIYYKDIYLNDEECVTPTSGTGDKKQKRPK